MFTFSEAFLKKYVPKITLRFYQRLPQPLRSKKPKSFRNSAQYFVDFRRVRTLGGRGGDGCISFLHLWSNEYAGPDGGDGGNGGHVVLQASTDVKDLNHLSTILKASDGERGGNKDCNGKSANHTIVNVPIGTIVKNQNGTVVGDLDKEGIMFLAARGGAGGKGNHFFVSPTEQAPEICEYGAIGEVLEYTLEIRSMADIGLIGLPNAGKSTLLQAISRAKPKIAPYPFTTLRPHLGIVSYDDYVQISVADLPGLIANAHRNKGLGIEFLKHAERCAALVFVLDLTNPEPWNDFQVLQNEISHFSVSFGQKPQIVAANKIDEDGATNKLEMLKNKLKICIIPVSAKYGTNLVELLQEIRTMCNKINSINI